MPSPYSRSHVTVLPLHDTNTILIHLPHCHHQSEVFPFFPPTTPFITENRRLCHHHRSTSVYMAVDLTYDSRPPLSLFIEVHIWTPSFDHRSACCSVCRRWWLHSSCGYGPLQLPRLLSATSNIFCHYWSPASQTTGHHWPMTTPLSLHSSQIHHGNTLASDCHLNCRQRFWALPRMLSLPAQFWHCCSWNLATYCLDSFGILSFIDFDHRQPLPSTIFHL